MRVRQADGKYVAQAVKDAKADGLPEWLEEFRTAAQANYVTERDSVEEGDIFTWPKKLEQWDASDVSQWWENPEFGIRAISRYHLDHPFVFHVGGQEFKVQYLPAESNTGMFGGNSNWRGPVWMPVNALLVRRC